MLQVFRKPLAALAALVLMAAPAFAITYPDGHSLPEDIIDDPVTGAPYGLNGNRPQPVYDISGGGSHASAYCQITIQATSTTLAAMLASGTGGSCAVPTWATGAYFRPEGPGLATVRCAYDATTLSATLGFPIDGNQDFGEPSSSFAAMKCISSSGATVLMDVEWRG